MGDIDNDAHVVAAADHLGALVRQAAMHRRFGLDVAQLVDAIMRQFQVPQRPASIRLIDPIWADASRAAGRHISGLAMSTVRRVIPVQLVGSHKMTLSNL